MEEKKEYECTNLELRNFKNAGYYIAQAMYANGDVSFDKNITKRFAPKMQNYIYTNNKEDFVMYITRLCTGYGISVPLEVYCILESENEEIFKERALAFLTGFISEKKEKNNNNKKEEKNE